MYVRIKGYGFLTGENTFIPPKFSSNFFYTIAILPYASHQYFTTLYQIFFKTLPDFVLLFSLLMTAIFIAGVVKNPDSHLSFSLPSNFQETGGRKDEEGRIEKIQLRFGIGIGERKSLGTGNLSF